MQLHDLVVTSKRISETSRRLEKIAFLAEFLRRLPPEEISIAVSYLSGNLPQGRIGVGYASLRESLPASSAPEPTLTLTEVDEAFGRTAMITGPGSAALRLDSLRQLLSRAVKEEVDFLFRLVLGELRQGSLEGIMSEALAKAGKVPIGLVRRALMVSGDLAAVGRCVLEEGESGLARFDIRILQPVQPMLAQSAEDVADAMASLGTAALEYKLDGARVQAHKAGDEIRIFTRQLNEVTTAVPELIQILQEMPAREAILDGEALALRENGTPLPFQDTMRRFGRKLNVEQMRGALPLTPFFFDCLYLDGESLIDRAAGDRFSALQAIVPAGFLIPRIVTDDRSQAEDFARRALNAGHEGIMAKAIDAPYEAGGRGKSWLKIKPAHTLDLVVLAAEWGHGRRQGWLSNLHLGARDTASGQFVMLGKTFKGLTDEMLAWQTQKLLELESSRDSWTVYVRPALVVEVAFNDIQTSPHYPSGLALRFARVKRYRADKKPEEVDTIESVRAIYSLHADD